MPSPRCPNCRKWFMSARQLAHHAANAARLCKENPMDLRERTMHRQNNTPRKLEVRAARREARL